MGYEEDYAVFMHHHLKSRTGERRGRLERGHGHGEALFLRNVWWALRDGFSDLHPEYEVMDWRGRSYFADFAWLPVHGPIKLLLEIKGYASHVRDLDRQQFCNELNRETFLTAMGYRIVSFAYDDVERRPELCMTLLRMVLGRFQPQQGPVSLALPVEQEVLRLAVQLAQPIRPLDVERHFDADHRTSVRLLHRLCAKGWLKPVVRGSGKRIVSYELTKAVWDYWE